MVFDLIGAILILNSLNFHPRGLCCVFFYYEPVNTEKDYNSAKTL